MRSEVTEDDQIMKEQNVSQLEVDFDDITNSAAFLTTLCDRNPAKSHSNSRLYDQHVCLQSE